MRQQKDETNVERFDPKSVMSIFSIPEVLDIFNPNVIRATDEQLVAKALLSVLHPREVEQEMEYNMPALPCNARHELYEAIGNSGDTFLPVAAACYTHAEQPREFIAEELNLVSMKYMLYEQAFGYGMYQIGG